VECDESNLFGDKFKEFSKDHVKAKKKAKEIVGAFDQGVRGRGSTSFGRRRGHRTPFRFGPLPNARGREQHLYTYGAREKSRRQNYNQNRGESSSLSKSLSSRLIL